MTIKTFEGTVEQGKVKLPSNIHLPEHTKVYVVVPEFLEIKEPVSNKKFNLAEMVSRMPPDYQVSEESFGKPVGKEEW